MNTRFSSDAARWPDHVRIAVNLSPVQFRSRHLAQVVIAACAAARVAPSRLELEVTEAAYQRDDRRTQSLLTRTAWAAGCTSWYKTASGRITNNWPTWTVRYWWETLRLRQEDIGVLATDRPGPRSERPKVAALGGTEER